MRLFGLLQGWIFKQQIPPYMIIPQHKKGLTFGHGLTLPELTLTIAVILGLTGILFAGTSVYASHANRAGCVMIQDQISKGLRSHSHLHQVNFRSGVDYYGEPIMSEVFENEMTCPESGGKFSCRYDSFTQQLIITCIDHGDNHR